MADVSPPVEMVKIQNEDRDLGFDGTNVEEFLHWYQKAAKEDGASEDDMAQQLGCFVLSDDLLNIVENMEGYEPPNWPKLKASMVAYWGRAKIPRFTLKDLERLLLSWSEKDDISPARDYPNFCDSLEPIVSHLLENNDISTEKLQNILYQAFSRVPQCSLHRSTSALKLNEILSRPEIDYRATINISSLLESPSTVFRDVMATPSVPNLDKGTLDAEPEPLKQSIEDPGEAAVSLLPPIPSPIQPSLFQSEVCLENDVKNNHIDVLDNSLCEISNVIVSDVVVSETLEEFDISVSDPFLGLCSCPLGLLRCPIHDNQLVEVTEVGERILSLDPLKRQIKKPVSDSQAKINLKVWEEPSGLGEDHNHFIDRFDPIDFNFNIDSPIFDITSTHNQEPKHFLDSVMSLIPNSDRQKASNPAKITKEISAPLGHHRLGPLSLNSATLRKENKSPIFHSKEEDVLFPEYSSMLHLKKDQDTLLQDFLQKPLRDENKLPSFHSKEEVLLQEPALLFQDLPQDPLRDKNTQLSFHLKNTNSFPEPVSPVWDQLRNEDKLSCVEFGQKEEAKWRVNGIQPSGEQPFQDQALSFQDRLRDENKLPPVHFEEALGSFCDEFAMVDSNEDQDYLFQAPAPPFQDSLQDSLRNEGKLLSFQVVCGQGTSIGCQRIRERGLISVEAERLEVSPLLSVHLRVDTPQFVKTLCPATFVSHAWPPFSFTRLTLLLPTIINHRGEIGQPLFYFEKSYDEFDQSHCARCWNEAPKTAIFLRFLGSQQSSASSSLPLHVFPLLSSYSLIASDITSRFELENDLTNNNINDRTTAPHSHNAPSLATDLIGFRSAFITPASELTKGDINIKPQSAIFSTQYLPSQEQSKMIRNLSRASNSHELLYLNDFLDYCLYSLSQAYYSASFASNSSVPTSEAHCGLSWNRSGIGPDHVFPSEDCLRNEDKLPSFCLNSRGPFPAEALLTKSKSSQICVASSG
ncbi:hypothetical protein MJO28_013009 [Puccinia striiformis f. sp. tritici]|uniref:Uncharacterized protein n=1 Tax=Puccinia striiformis f. sp. tritici TaxID=168172 RepID=A0ACC0DZ54_9BASI|nr:hypothetical protein MJO28_013009 [Puccinia striiformis f. sp. tritici]